MCHDSQLADPHESAPRESGVETEIQPSVLIILDARILYLMGRGFGGGVWASSLFLFSVVGRAFFPKQLFSCGE